MPPRDEEERPLLSGRDSSYQDDEPQELKFADDDEEENPRAWTERRKLTNVFVISLMAILSPLASSMFTPGISQIAEDLHTSEASIIATTTGYVIMLGIGPLILAPFSETFGRRPVYIWSFMIFSILQIPTALSPNAAVLIVVRTVSGFFGSVGIANGGGTISDMYRSSQRAGIFGWYLLGVLLGPTIGPILGGVIVTRLNWRWVYWILAIVCTINTSLGYVFLRESYVPALLSQKKRKITDQHGGKYYFEGEDERPLRTKLLHSMKRPVVIFIQPIVFTMALYQAIIFGTTYSIYTNMQTIFSNKPYSFSSEQVGLLFLGPGLGFFIAVWFLVPRIDTIFNKLTEMNNGKSQPEYRLPLANIGSVFIPVALFWFAWTVNFRLHWAICITSTVLYGIGQVAVFNCVQNYYIDSFEKYAASAIAGGSVFRSFVGGVAPLFAPAMFQKLGYGWGISVFGLLSLLIAPSPILFYRYGERLRERFPIKL